MNLIAQWNTGNNYVCDPSSIVNGQVISVYDVDDGLYFIDHSRGIDGRIPYASEIDFDMEKDDFVYTVDKSEQASKKQVRLYYVDSDYSTYKYEAGPRDNEQKETFNALFKDDICYLGDWYTYGI
tara:strand:- start:41 stop:415 length:375 start_codon:yes stop_codon:yes gene_type:complete